jgi:cobalt-zinc-cadmium efflux system membrane fusion protein
MPEDSTLKEETKTIEATKAVEEKETPGGERSRIEVETVTAATPSTSRNRSLTIVSIVVIVALFVVVALLWWSRSGGGSSTGEKAAAEAGQPEEHGSEEGGEVKLSTEALAAAAIEIEAVTQRPAVALLRVTGAVEANQQQTQQATPLIGGRVERVLVAPGDRVRAGSVLAVIASPQIAQMHGKLHESETALQLAERNLQRVERSENRVAVLSAKARLDEAEATLKRTRRLIELGAGAGKDLIAAETAYKTAKAEHDFQHNISLNKELQEARAAVETSRVDVGHIRDEMRALGAPVPPAGERDDHSRNTSLVAVVAPVSGVVTERLVNAGAGIEPGKPMFTIANLSTVWVVANVPEAQVGSIRVGMPVEVRSATLGGNPLSGQVGYIDPQLNEETRTGRVRVELSNPGERLKTGMFVEVGFQVGTGATTGEELMVSSAAVQRIGDRTVVFLPKDEPGHFEVRDVELGGETNEYRKVLSGLQLGDRVVTKGSFTLKTQLMKGQLGEDE